MPCSHGKLAVITEALFTLVTEGRTQLPVTQKPLAPIRRKLGTSACSKYCGSPPSISMIKILRGIVLWSPESFAVIPTTQHRTVRISGTARLRRHQAAEMLQDGREFGQVVLSSHPRYCQPGSQGHEGRKVIGNGQPWPRGTKRAVVCYD